MSSLEYQPIFCFQRETHAKLEPMIATPRLIVYQINADPVYISAAASHHLLAMDASARVRNRSRFLMFLIVSTFYYNHYFLLQTSRNIVGKLGDVLLKRITNALVHVL